MISESDKSFRNSIETCRWTGPFGHADHIRLAWIYLREYETNEATRRCGKALRNLAQSHGDFGKYHETLTVAMMRLVASHVEEVSPAENWESFQARVRPLFESARELIARHYSARRLAQPEARTRFLPPDREPL